MRKGLAKVAVYPLLLINLAAGVLWAASARSFFFLIVEWLYRDGRLTGGRVSNVPFILKSFDNLFTVVAVLGLLALFVVLEYTYTRAAERGLLMQRFLRVLGLEILLLGLVHLALDLMLGQVSATAFGPALAWLELGAGSVLFAVTYLREKRVPQ